MTITRYQELCLKALYFLAVRYNQRLRVEFRTFYIRNYTCYTISSYLYNIMTSMRLFCTVKKMLHSIAMLYLRYSGYFSILNRNNHIFLKEILKLPIQITLSSVPLWLAFRNTMWNKSIRYFNLINFFFIFFKLYR